jgi:cobalt-zinc-cadmium efflux system membrane fusion protein
MDTRHSKTVMALKCLCLLAVAGMTGCHRESDIKIPEPPQPTVQGEKVSFPTDAPQLSSLSVQPAELRTFAITHLTGRLYWNDESTVRVFTPVAGRVLKVLADLGDRVEVGTPLALIDSPDFNMALANARTAVGNLVAADKAYSRSKELLAHGAAAEKDVEAAEAAFVAAAAEKDRSEAVLANYGGTVKTTNSIYTLRSPLAGILVDKNVNPGQELRADLMLANSPNLFAPQFIVSDPTTLWLQVDVAETDLGLLQPGLELHVFSRAFPDRVFEGRIEKISDTMDPATRTVKVRAVVKNPDKLLKAEMYVQVDIENKLAQTAEAGVEVPAKAIFMRQEQSFLFVESAPGQFERKRVKVGAEKDGKVPVFDGVIAGQKVVSEGALLLQSLVEPAS